MKWNPRFVAYAKAHGKTPSGMLKHDEEAWPGGIMCGFVLWIAEMKKKFLKSDPNHCCILCSDMSIKFDTFLKNST